MIQRPQTVYFMVLAIWAAVVMFGDWEYFSIAENNATVQVQYDETVITADGETESLRNTGMFYLLAVIILLAAASILSFKNRKLQGSITAFNMVAILGLIILMYFYSYRMDYFESTKGNLNFMAATPALLLIMNYLGLRGIRKDERLVRSMDRFR